eukprot:Sspe_Gene.19297::Locus_7024_Transcript_2_3_Confidence_0.500_Length_2881::g.19297::m.19297
MPVPLTSLSTAGWGLLIGLVVVAMWIPASIISTGAVVDAREDQMIASLSMVREQVLGFFQVGSRSVLMLQRMYKAAMISDPTSPTKAMSETHGNSLWHFLKEHPSVSTLFASNLMRPDAVGHPTCDLSIVVYSGVIHINVYEGMSGVNNSYPTVCKNTTSPYPCGADTFRVRFVKGHPVNNVSDPGSPGRFFSDTPCSRGAGSSSFMWSPAASPQTNATFHGVTAPSWDAQGRVQGRVDRRATILRVTAPVEGPSWAPLSGLVGAQLLVSEPVIPTNTSKTLSNLIRESMEKVKLEMTIVLFTSELELLGNSLGVLNSRKDSDGVFIGFLAADNASAVPGHIAMTARHLRENHCVDSDVHLDPWERRCKWDGVPELFHLNGYTVAALPVNDPLASGLGMLLVCIVDDSKIREQAEQLNIQLSIISPVVLAVGCALAFLFSYSVSKPISVFCASLREAADMKGLETFPADVAQGSYIKEVVMMHQALADLVKALLEYKSYLPGTMFKDELLKSGTFPSIVIPTDEEHSQSERSTEDSKSSKSSAYLAKGEKMRTVCVLQKRKCAVMATNLVSWTRHVMGCSPDEVLFEISTYIELVMDCVKKTGTLDRFNGDQVLVSWNTWHSVPGFRKVACQVAHEFRLATVASGLTCSVGVGLAAGSVLSGNAGSRNIRAFNLIGVPVTHAVALCSIASEHSFKVVTLVSEQVAEAGVPFVAPIAGSVEIRKLEKQRVAYRKVFHELLDPMLYNDEWMYTVGEQAVGQCVNLFSRIFKSPAEFGDLHTALHTHLSNIRDNMVFADKGWSKVVDGIGQGKEGSIFYHV